MAGSTPGSTPSWFTHLLDGIPVTPSSTTSRVVVNSPALRVVVFALDAGELLTEHSSPRAVVVQLLDGSVRFTVSGEEHLLVQQNAASFRAMDGHRIPPVDPPSCPTRPSPVRLSPAST
jgi:hypothetical protein